MIYLFAERVTIQLPRIKQMLRKQLPRLRLLYREVSSGLRRQPHKAQALRVRVVLPAVLQPHPRLRRVLELKREEVSSGLLLQLQVS
jgi:hypothetical protein